MKNALVALGCGILFGVALAVSGAANPRVILGFLDITGDFRPELAGVIAAALAVNFIVWPRVLRRSRPWLAESFALPTRKDIDVRLVVGACLFGVGWGLSGYCVGPALTSLVAATRPAATYLGAVIVGYGLYALVTARLAKA